MMSLGWCMEVLLRCQKLLGGLGGGGVYRVRSCLEAGDMKWGSYAANGVADPTCRWCCWHFGRLWRGQFSGVPASCSLSLMYRSLVFAWLIDRCFPQCLSVNFLLLWAVYSRCWWACSHIVYLFHWNELENRLINHFMWCEYDVEQNILWLCYQVHPWSRMLISTISVLSLWALAHHLINALPGFSSWTQQITQGERSKNIPWFSHPKQQLSE